MISCYLDRQTRPATTSLPNLHKVWKVLTARWCGFTEAVVVWYYNVVLAAAEGIDEEEMVDAIDKGDSFDCL